jgi:hypothetical protein
MKKAKLLTILTLFITSYLLSQENRYIFSGEINQKQSIEDEAIHLNKIAIEQHNYKFLSEGEIADKILPVVFHILYSDDHEIVPIEMILAQLDALNRDFGEPKIEKEKIAPNHLQFAELATNPHIQFCLASKDPNGKDTKGIEYHRLFNKEWGLGDSIFNPFEGGIAPWDSELYINIWVAKMQPNVYGFAQSPGGKIDRDGIVIDYSFLGINSELNQSEEMRDGKILTHLMGNYLGLISLWGEKPCTDDYLWDTPVHNGPNFGYLGPGQISICPLYGYPLEMTENFMDSTPDSIRHMFTRQQVNRMHAALSEGGTRSGLLKTKIECKRNKQDLDILERSAKEQQSGIKIQIFPNPAVDLLCIRVFSDDDSKLDLQVFNAVGQTIHRQKVIYEQVVINMDQWGSGTYFFKFTKDNKVIEIKTVNLTH